MSETSDKLEELLKEWTADCEIDELALDKAAIKIAKLHSKYAGTLARHNILMKKFENDYMVLRKTKRMWMSGELSKQELKDLGWDQWLLGKPLKDQMVEYLEQDKDLMKIGMKIVYHREIADFCREALKQLHNRGWQLRAAIDFQKMINGS